MLLSLYGAQSFLDLQTSRSEPLGPTPLTPENGLLARPSLRL